MRRKSIWERIEDFYQNNEYSWVITVLVVLIPIVIFFGSGGRISPNLFRQQQAPAEVSIDPTRAVVVPATLTPTSPASAGVTLVDGEAQTFQYVCPVGKEGEAPQVLVYSVTLAGTNLNWVAGDKTGTQKNSSIPAAGVQFQIGVSCATAPGETTVVGALRPDNLYIPNNPPAP